jgi:RNA recognition motif-containing protein
MNSPLKNNKTSRAGLPTQWLDGGSTFPDNRSLSSPNNSDLSSGGGSPPLPHINAPSIPSSNQGAEDEIIPTAIVIKNIPFNVKRETLLEIIASLSIPTPYAFNYHLDQSGSFRGLAFANFRQASDADAVVAALNGFDVQGRKLRVEYKKVLQAGEKERIEREKAIRRMRSMQLEKEQHQHQQLPVAPQTPYDEFPPVIAPPFTPQRSYSGPNYQPPQQYSPPSVPPISVPQTFSVQTPPPPIPVAPSPSLKGNSASNELDLNDPSTLEIYSRILLFKDDRMRDELAFSRTLSPKQRRIVHLVAQKLGVYHYSVGEGEERYAVVTRIDPEKRQQGNHHPGLQRMPSAYLSPTSPTSGGIPPSLRVKKSMPDMGALRSQAPRLTTRSSNGNIREGYATIASPSRRLGGGFGSLFGNSSPFDSHIPPVPSLPSSLDRLESPTSGVVRQPRGPGVGGFNSRREQRVVASESALRGLDARSHEPLEM